MKKIILRILFLPFLATFYLWLGTPIDKVMEEIYR